MIMRFRNTILYAEDDLDDFDTLNEVLIDLDNKYNMIHARNGLDVLSYLESNGISNKPALIILDGNMPGMNGRETLECLMKMHPYNDIPVTVFSTHMEQEVMDLCGKHNCLYRQKPGTFRELIYVANEMLSLARQNNMILHAHT